MKINSRAKGARGERLWRDELRAQGYEARRGQQFSGSPESPDVVCAGLPQFHFEVKCVEKLNIMDAMEQAKWDAEDKMKDRNPAPVVAHKRNHSEWLVTMRASDWFDLVREKI